MLCWVGEREQKQMGRAHTESRVEDDRSKPHV